MTWSNPMLGSQINSFRCIRYLGYASDPSARPHDPPSADTFAHREEARTGHHQWTTMALRFDIVPRVLACYWASLSNYVPIIRWTPRNCSIWLRNSPRGRILTVVPPLSFKTLRSLFPSRKRRSIWSPRSGKHSGFRMRLQMMPSSLYVSLKCDNLLNLSRSFCAFVNIGICGNFICFQLHGLQSMFFNPYLVSCSRISMICTSTVHPVRTLGK